jgi:hypothetical protein
VRELAAGALAAGVVVAVSGVGGSAHAACGGSAGGGAAAAVAFTSTTFRHYAANVYSPAYAVYRLEFALGSNARLAGDRVWPPAVAALRVTNAGRKPAPLGRGGCAAPVVVRVVYPLPAAAVGHLASLAQTVAPGPGGDRVIYLDYRFRSGRAHELAPGTSALLVLTARPPAFAPTSEAAATALQRTLAGRPVEVMVDGGQRPDGSFPFDGGTLCDVSWPNGGATPLMLVAAWDGGGAPYLLSDGDSCQSVGIAANGTAQANIRTPRGG